MWFQLQVFLVVLIDVGLAFVVLVGVLYNYVTVMCLMPALAVPTFLLRAVPRVFECEAGFLLCSWHFLAVWNNSTSFSRTVVVPNDRCFVSSIFTIFSARCVCIEGLENPHLRTIRPSLRWCELSSNAPLIVSSQSFSSL